MGKEKREGGSLGLYCHVPFCANGCHYCAFYKERPLDSSIDDYLDGIAEEFSLLAVRRPFDTVYVGGGTPGVLTAPRLEKLCGTLLRNNGTHDPLEFSVEFSPRTVRADKIRVLKDHGVNRVTVGVQSFNPKTLRILGRRQVAAGVYPAHRTILDGGIENIGLDLIFGCPGQTLDEWLADLQAAVDLEPKHISAYNLTVEDGTRLQTALVGNGIGRKSADEEAEFYRATVEFLGERGYGQYEISNFSLPGFESIHNSNTWEMGEWIGIGPAACSQYGGWRFSNPPSLPLWLQSLKRGRLAHANTEWLSEQTLAEDRMIFGLRMNRGIDLLATARRFPSVDLTVLETFFLELADAGYMEFTRNRLHLTTDGMLLADAIAVKILEILHG